MNYVRAEFRGGCHRLFRRGFRGLRQATHGVNHRPGIESHQQSDSDCSDRQIRFHELSSSLTCKTGYRSITSTFPINDMNMKNDRWLATGLFVAVLSAAACNNGPAPAAA